MQTVHSTTAKPTNRPHHNDSKATISPHLATYPISAQSSLKPEPLNLTNQTNTTPAQMINPTTAAATKIPFLQTSSVTVTDPIISDSLATSAHQSVIPNKRLRPSSWDQSLRPPSKQSNSSCRERKPLRRTRDHSPQSRHVTPPSRRSSCRSVSPRERSRSPRLRDPAIMHLPGTRSSSPHDRFDPTASAVPTLPPR